MTVYNQIEQASLTDVGLRRSHNQDAHAVLPASDVNHWCEIGHVFIVADGMGAHAVGELASKLAVDNILHTYHKHAHEGAALALRKAFLEANATIHARGQQNREFEGMGTTGTTLVLRPEGAWIGHVGDSRTYRIRGGKIEQLSYDHSLLWELARRQKITPEEVTGVPSNVIVRSLGPEALVQVDVEGPHPLQIGDIFVMCSDGLSGPVHDPEIGSIALNLPPDEACRLLIDLANLRGGPDNITVVIARVVGTSPDAATAATASLNRTAQRAPWGLSVLIGGVVLACGAVGLLAMRYQMLGIAAFILAAFALIVGFTGLVLQVKQNKALGLEEMHHYRKVQVYRQTPCQVDQELLTNMADAIAKLKQQIRDKQWDADWETFQKQRTSAESNLARGDLENAFRDYCRAMRPLAEVVQRHRHKEEVFLPQWDKKKEK